jgi:hypothetical protein
MNENDPVTSIVRLSAPGNDAGLRPPALVSVDIDEGEELDWVWTYLADGRRTVTGYRLRPRLPEFARMRR